MKLRGRYYDAALQIPTNSFNYSFMLSTKKKNEPPHYWPFMMRIYRLPAYFLQERSVMQKIFQCQDAIRPTQHWLITIRYTLYLTDNILYPAAHYITPNHQPQVVISSYKTYLILRQPVIGSVLHYWLHHPLLPSQTTRRWKRANGLYNWT